MKGSTAIRKKLGLTQHELAGLLQVSRSTINMYELGKRSLPVAALLKLGQLEIVYNQAQQNRLPALRQISTTAAEENTRNLSSILQGKIQACRNKAAQLQQQLQVMQQDHNRLACLLITMHTWQQEMNGMPGSEKAQLQSDIQQYHIQQKIIGVGTEEQFILQQEIDLQLYMATTYESALDKLSRGEV